MTCTSGSTGRNQPVRLSHSPVQSLREQSQLSLALLWPRGGDGKEGGDREEGDDGLLLQALAPRELHPPGSSRNGCPGLLLGV